MVYNIDVPEMDGKKGYIASIFQSRMQLRQILTIPELGGNPMGIYWMIKIIIQDEIRDDDLRRNTLKELDASIDKRMKEYREKCGAEPDRRNQDSIVIDEAIRALDACTVYNDKYLGIGQKNKIQVTKLKCANCEYRLKSIKGNEEVEEDTDEEE